MERFSVYEGFMEDLKKKVTRIQNKCRKYGCDFHFEEVGEEYKEVENFLCLDPYTRKPKIEVCRFVIVEVEGTAKVNDWEFVGRIEHTSKGNIFSKALTDVEIPERYRFCDPYCEHCKTNRSRKDTFIVRNFVTDEFMQVGKSCLMDFTHGMSAECASYLASLKMVFREAEQAPTSFGSHRELTFDKEEILQYTAETIKHFGYVRSSDAYYEGLTSTNSKMWDFFLVSTGRTTWMHDDVIKAIKKEMKQVNFNPESEDTKKLVRDALNWINEQEASNDYMHNLKTVCSLDYVSADKTGILVSLFPTYNKDLERQAEKVKREAKRKAERVSQWVGEVGQRITFDVESVTCVTSWTNCFDGWHETTTFLYKIKDTNGNIFIWKTAKNIEDITKITGTVKEHSEFREVKQTVLTRCKVA